ncbi:MAG: hypothetical protein ACK5HR_06655 [Mycoplasmatales bacterium]
MKNNRKYFILVFIVFFIYIVIQSTNYMLEYKIEKHEENIEKIKNEINEIKIKENLSLSREKAINEYKLSLNNNIYYLEEEDE